MSFNPHVDPYRKHVPAPVSEERLTGRAKVRATPQYPIAVDQLRDGHASDVVDGWLEAIDEVLDGD